MDKKIQIKKALLTLSLMIIGVLILSACSPAAAPEPTQDTAMIQTQAAQTVVADMNAAVTQTPAPPPGATPDPNMPVAVIPTAAPGEPAAIADYNTAILSGPGTNYVVYGAFLGGATAKVVGKSEDGIWWAISVPVAPTGSGWVHSDWVTVSGADSVPMIPAPPVPATVEMVPPSPEDPQAVVIANTEVRSGPAANFPAYGIATEGASARVIGKSEDALWWVVRLDPTNVGTGYGWILAQFTQASNVTDIQTIENPETPENIPAAPPPTGVPSATAVDYVNLRTGPGTNYPVLGVAKPGATGEVSGKSADGGWWQVKDSHDIL